VPGQQQTTLDTHIAEFGKGSARQPVDDITEDHSENAGKGSNTSKIVEEAPFTINDLQSELSSALSVPHPATDNEWGADFTASGASPDAALLLDQHSISKQVGQHVTEPESGISSQGHDDWAEVDFVVPDAEASDAHLASDRASSQAGVALDSSSTASLPSQQQTGTDEHPSAAVSAGTVIHQQPSQSSSADAGTSGQLQYEEADAFSGPKADTAQPDDWTDNAFQEEPATAEQAVCSGTDSADADGAVGSSQQASAGNWADHSFSSDAAQAREALSESIKTEASSRTAPTDAVSPAGQASVNSDWADAAFPADIQAAASQSPDASDADTSHRQIDTAAGDESTPDQAVASAGPQAAQHNALAEQSTSADASTAAGSNDTSDKAGVSVQEVGVDDWADQVSPGEAATAAPIGASAKQVAAEQVAADDDWGDDDFGDFNDAAEQGDDDGFGAFNEADAEAGSSEAPAAQSPQSQPQHQQKPASPAGTRHNKCSLHDRIIALYWSAVTRLDHCLTLCSRSHMQIFVCCCSPALPPDFMLQHCEQQCCIFAADLYLLTMLHPCLKVSSKLPYLSALLLQGCTSMQCPCLGVSPQWLTNLHCCCCSCSRHASTINIVPLAEHR